MAAKEKREEVPLQLLTRTSERPSVNRTFLLVLSPKARRFGASSPVADPRADGFHGLYSRDRKCLPRPESVHKSSMSLDPIGLLAAHPWQRVTCTTFSLSLSFFEAIILDGLVRGKSSDAVILSDVHGVRASLAERGAQRVGKDYLLEPVEVSGGVFHPKVTVLSSSTECHILVGSGNLTFGGWGGNCEFVEHLHPTFAASAIADVARFFDLLADHNRVRHGAATRCALVADDLRRGCEGYPANSDIRFLHNLGEPLGSQFVSLAAELGGAEQLVAIAPYWDTGDAISDLCDKLGLPEVRVHSHRSGTVGGAGSNNWPRSARVRVVPVRLAHLAEDEERRLHAKAFEIICKRGRVLISGSANGSTAALGASHNVEACVARIHHARTRKWVFMVAVAPAAATQAELPEDAIDTPIGVLRAVLDADRLSGSVLTPVMCGKVTVSHLTSGGYERLATAEVDTDGNFSARTPNFEGAAWRRGRVVIRIEDVEGRQAEGFVTVVSVSEITRRGGVIARRLFAVVTGTETDEDVAAIIEWLHEDPRRLLAARGAARTGSALGSTTPDPHEVVDVRSLRSQALVPSAEGTSGTSGDLHWKRFSELVLAAFRKPRDRVPARIPRRPQYDDDAGDDEVEAGAPDENDDPQTERSFGVLNTILRELVAGNPTADDVLMALDLTGFVCDRLRPDAATARQWLALLLNVQSRLEIPEERKPDIVAASLAVLRSTPTPEALRSTRGRLLRMGVNFTTLNPNEEAASRFVASLPGDASFSTLWQQLSVTRSYAEQRDALIRAWVDGRSSDDYPDLRSAAPHEWPVLEQAIATPAAMNRISILPGVSDTCPECDIVLPPGARMQLNSVGIASAVGCCHRVLVVRGT